MDFITPKSNLTTKCAFRTRTAEKFSPTNPRCEVDVNSVKVFSRKEWNQLHYRMHTEEMVEQELKKLRQAKEEMKEKSKEMYKDWTNTYLGARAKKLQDREKRLALEESERLKLDQEEAKYQAEQRRQKLCQARTLQYYGTARMTNFHCSLKLTEVIKERDLQLQLKQLMERRSAEKEKKEYEELLKAIDEGVKKENEKLLERREKTIENAKFNKERIVRHQKENEALREEERIEGAQICRLAAEAAETQHQIGLSKMMEQKRMNQVLLNEICDHKKREQVEKLKEEELDEKIRIYATGKRNLTLMKLDNEAKLYELKHTKQHDAFERLSNQLKMLKDDEEELRLKAVHEQETKFADEERAKLEKQRIGMEGVLEFRHESMKQKAQQKLLDEKEAKDELRRRLDEAERIRLEDENKKISKREKALEVARHNREKFAEKVAKENTERQEMIEFVRLGGGEAKMEEELFQDYAKRVINVCESGGRNTFSLKREAAKGKGDGIGTNLPGMGSIKTSVPDADPKCRVLPDITLPIEFVHL